MQTFLPYPDFWATAACLDPRRLGKQRVECLQILHALQGITPGWSHHPAVRMWAGYEQCLASYALAICNEWSGRGYRDTVTAAMEDYLLTCPDWDEATMNPPWLGSPAFHASHRAALLAKDPAHYSTFGWTEAPAIAYIWPTKEPATCL